VLVDTAQRALMAIPRLASIGPTEFPPVPDNSSCITMTLDNWDPALTDPLAVDHDLTLFDSG